MGLAPLRASSEKGCRLCKYIWQQVAVNKLGGYAKANTASLVEDRFMGQIYFGLHTWDLKITGIPFLEVNQLDLEKGTLNNLVFLDIFAEQSEFFHVLLPRFIYSISDGS